MLSLEQLLVDAPLMKEDGKRVDHGDIAVSRIISISIGHFFCVLTTLPLLHTTAQKQCLTTKKLGSIWMARYQ
jgi:hypothetical protein